MRDKPNDGGPAFPMAMTCQYGTTKGMTKREWFAGQALAGGVQCARNVGRPLTEYTRVRTMWKSKDRRP